MDLKQRRWDAVEVWKDVLCAHGLQFKAVTVYSVRPTQPTLLFTACMAAARLVGVGASTCRR